MFHGTNNTDSMPVHHVDGPRPPMLLISGSDDDTVRLCNTNDMSERLKRFGSDVKVIIYKGVGHMGVILSLVPGLSRHRAAAGRTCSISSVRIDGEETSSCPTG